MGSLASFLNWSNKAWRPSRQRRRNADHRQVGIEVLEVRQLLTIPADFTEPQNTLATAHNMGTIHGNFSLSSLTIHSSGEDDWFRFKIDATGTSAHNVRLEFSHAQGDVDAVLYNSSGTAIASATSVTDNEEISLSGRAAGVYYLKVYGHSGATNPSYTLRVSGPTTGAAGDFAESNNSLGAAYDLGTIPGDYNWTGFSIHNSSDVDWFRFETRAAGGAGSYVRTTFAHSQGDVDMTLYNSSGGEIDSATSVTDNEEISLSGRAAGVYYLRVYGYNGATNSSYGLALSAPSIASTSAGDFAEANDSLGAAYSLGTLSGSDSWSGLSIHATGNDDWFQFQTTAAASTGHSVGLSFSHALGDIDMSLHDSAGNTINYSAGVTNTESISLAGLAAGTYYVRVYGYSGATNPNYTLSVNAPAAAVGDAFEPNDTRGTASLLGALGGAHSWSGLSIHAPGNEDWFQFQTGASGTTAHSIGLAFNHALGDVDMQLVDSSGNVLNGSYSVGNAESISLAGLPAGTYYVQVYGFNGATNPDYTLSITAPGGTIAADSAEPNDTRGTAFNLGSVEGSQTFGAYSISPAGDNDWFRFETTAPGLSGHYVAATFSHAQGDVDMRLRRADGTIISTAAGVSDREQLSLAGLPAGVYYVQLYEFNGATNPEYRLHFNAPTATFAGDAAEPNDTRATAYDLRSVQGHQQWGPFSISPTGDYDWFRFETAGPGVSGHYARIDFLHAAGDVDMRLYNSAGTEIDAATGVGDREQISLAGRAAGTYYVRVYGFGGATNPEYRLTLNAPTTTIPADYAETNDTRATAYDLRTLTAPFTSGPLSIHGSSDSDWFRFETVGTGGSSHNVRLNLTHSFGDVDMELRDASGNYLASSTGTGDLEQISLSNRPAGVYYIRAYGYSGNTNPNYTLTITPPAGPTLSGDAAEQNDTRGTAFDLRTVEGTFQQSGLSLHSSTDVDWFKFRTTSTAGSGHHVRVAFDHARGDVDLELYDAAGTRLLRSNGTGNTEEVSLQGLASGVYYARVYGYSGATNPSYTLSINAPAPASVSADRLEANDTRGTATLVRTGTTSNLTGSQTLTGLSIHSATDQDFFKFTTVATGTAAHGVGLQFQHANGDLDLELLNSSGNRVTLANSSTDNERISLQGLAAGTYYARVFGHSGAMNTYDLQFDAPTTSTTPPSAQDAWTIMVYVTASDLEQYAFEDINEMEIAASRLPGTVNIAVLWDQSSARTTYATGAGSQARWGTAGRAIITPDTNSSTVATRFELLGEQNTGDPTTLRNFIEWASATAPAQNYALVMWDHGAGLQGFNFDNADGGTSDNLTTNEFVGVLSSAGMPEIDLIAFDACLMGMTEVGFAVRDRTDVFVASQEVVGARGYDYSTAFAGLVTNPGSVTAQGLATSLVQSYQAQYGGSAQGWDTLSATLTSRYNALATALRTFTTAASSATSGDLTVMQSARNSAVGYEYSYLRDLGGFMRTISNNSSVTGAIRTAAGGVISAINNLVLTKTNDGRNSSGVSNYFPAIGSSVASWYASQYEAFSTATGWGSFLNTLIGNRTTTRSGIASDWSESNDVAASAYNLNLLSGTGHAFADLSLHTDSDVDWFRFEIGADATTGHRVRVIAADAAQTIRVQIFDSTGTTLLGGSTGTGTRTVNLAGQPAGTYLVKVSTTGGEAISSYTLQIDAPTAAAADWAGVNNTSGKAFSLGLIAGTQVFSGLNLPTGQNDWFSFDTPRLAQATPYNLQVAGATGASLTAEIRNAGDNSLVAQTTGTGTLNLSYTATGGGEQYRLVVRNASGASVAYNIRFTVSDGVVVDGNTATISGTVGDDVFTFIAGGSNHVVTINGERRTFNASEVTNFVFQGGLGYDSLTVTGTPGNETVSMNVGAMTLTHAGYGITSESIEHNRVIGNGGTDTATLHDSEGDDRFVGRDIRSYMLIPNVFFNDVKGFATVTARAINGGDDRAQLYDSAGDDRLTLRPLFAQMSGPGNVFRVNAESFERGYGYSQNGGNDRVDFSDSAGNDTFVSQRTEARMVGDGFWNFARGFNRLFATSTAGRDVAHYQDVVNADTTYGRNDFARLTRTTREDRVSGFFKVKAYARDGHRPRFNVQDIDYIFEALPEGVWR